MVAPVRWYPLVEVPGEEGTLKRSQRGVSLLAIAGLLIAVGACEITEPSPEEREAVLTAVSGYLDGLARAYSTFDLSPLEGVASPNEIAAVRKLIKNLAMTGDRVHSTLKLFEVEEMEIFREVNATVRLIEVWDVVRYQATTGVEKGHTPNSIQYTVLQLRLVDGEWFVVGRSVLSRETPAPDSPEEQTE